MINRCMTGRTLNSSFKVASQRIVVIDMCAALLAPPLRLEAMLRALGTQGVEIACYSALDGWSTRRALRLAGIMEWFDYIWHLDAIMKMRRDELDDLRQLVILHTPQQLNIKEMCIAAGVPVAKVPPWLKWLV